MRTRLLLAAALAGAAAAAAGCGPDERPEPSPLVRLKERLVAENRAAPEEAPTAVAARVARSNAALLRAALPGCADLAEQARRTGRRIATRPDPGGPLQPAEAEDLRLLAFTYVQHTKALARVVEDHGAFAGAVELDARTRTLGVAERLAAGLAQQDLSLAFVGAFDDVKIARAQLDRPLERDGLPSRLYAKLRDSSRALGGRAALRDAIDRFQAAEVQRLVLADPEDGDLRWLAGRIYASASYDELRKDEELGRILARGPEKMATLFVGAGATADERVRYPAQVFIANVIGDAVTSPRGPRIPPELATRVRRETVRPGDILLRRCDVFVSNLFLPGWWGHAALFVGGRADVDRLGLADDAGVRPHLEDMERRGLDIVEAVGDGVTLSTLAHFLEADHAAVLRPRYPDDEARRLAIRRAYAHLGKAYDFEFDFESDDVLVCSELCWRALDGIVPFTLTRRFGRFTLTPDEIAARAVGPEAMLDLVLFIQDGAESDRSGFERRIE